MLKYLGVISQCLHFIFKWFIRELTEKKTRKRRRRGRWDRKEEKKEGQRVEGKGERESEEI